MFSKPMKLVSMIVIVILVMMKGMGCVEGKRDISFTDDFENGAAKWDFLNPIKTKIVGSGDPRHGNVLSLHPGGPGAFALIKGPDNWTKVKVEGDFFFPSGFVHQMGLIYNYNLTGPRADFGAVLIHGYRVDEYNKSPGKYRKQLEQDPDGAIGSKIMIEPQRDSYASGYLYPEYCVILEGDSAVRAGQWFHFKAEIVGPSCHFYLDDMKTPQVTYPFHEHSSGRIGFNPGYYGSECWLDNITVTSIDGFSYKGPALPPLPPGRNYKPGQLITGWNVIGPFYKRISEIETDGYLPQKSYVIENKEYKWTPFKTDKRGCVLGRRVCEYFSGRWYAYFHTEIFSRGKGTVSLEFSSTNQLIVRVNGSLAGDIKPQPRAWYDFWENPDHKGEKIHARLNPENNHLVVLVRGGKYGGDGFFAYCHRHE